MSGAGAGPAVTGGAGSRGPGRKHRRRNSSAAPTRVPSGIGPIWARKIGQFLAHIVWSTRIVGADRVPRTGPVLIAANHTGVIDGPVVFGCVPRSSHFLVKMEAFRGPIGWILRAAGQIPVDRSHGRQALTTALAELRRGRAVGIFPEGGRGAGDAASVRAGVAWLAVHAGAPVVPVAIFGTRRPGEGKGAIPKPRRRLYVEFGEPIVLPDAGTGRQAVADAMERIRTGLAGLVADATERAGAEITGSREPCGPAE